MTKQDELIAWVKKELDERGWNRAKLAEEAGISKGAISELLNGRPSGEKVLVGIARAFQIDAEFVLAKAGKQPKRPDMTPRISEMVALFSVLPDEEQENELAGMRAKVERHKRSKRVRAVATNN